MLGGHIDGSVAFWDNNGVDVPAGYRLLDVPELAEGKVKHTWCRSLTI